ncbi:MAG: hypothetical protein ACOYXS_01140 [Chloroflexota bacterium]
MTEALQQVWDATLRGLEQLVVPDWGAIVRTLPVLVGLLVVIAGGLLARRWATALAADARRRARPRAGGTTGAGRARGWFWPWFIPVGVLLTLAGLVFRPVDPATGNPAPANLPVLILGVAMTLLFVAASVAEWEQAETDTDPGARTGSAAGVRHHPTPGERASRRGGVPGALRLVPIGVIVVLGGLVLTPRDPRTGAPDPANLPVLVAGVIVVLAAVAAAVAEWEHTESESPAAGALGSGARPPVPAGPGADQARGQVDSRDRFRPSILP